MMRRPIKYHAVQNRGPTSRPPKQEKAGTMARLPLLQWRED